MADKATRYPFVQPAYSYIYFSISSTSFEIPIHFPHKNSFLFNFLVIIRIKMDIFPFLSYTYLLSVKIFCQT